MNKNILKMLAAIVLLGLAFIHWFLPALVEKSMNVVVPHPAYQIQPDAARLH